MHNTPVLAFIYTYVRSAISLNTTMAVIALAVVFCFLVDVSKSNDDVSLQSLETLVQQQSAVIQQQAAVIQQQASQLQVLKSKVDSQQTQLTHLTADLGTLKATRQKQAAFSVTFSGGNHPLNVGDNAAIRFNKVVTNVGNGYTPSTGLFTAPHTGVYAFFSSLRSDNNHGWIMLGIYKGETLLADLTADGAGDPWDRGTTFVTTHLNKGEQVYVRHNGGDTYLESGPFTTFSGVLVSAD